ncbi:hypothetical protein CLOM621_08908 [Clostridium sp. M62/1]|nr:hypothetical protein CLOM621_08908 [Clostridium sp. M62/1]
MIKPPWQAEDKFDCAGGRPAPGAENRQKVSQNRSRKAQALRIRKPENQIKRNRKK